MSSRERIFLSPPHMSGREQEMVNEAFATNYRAPVGPMLERFEKDVCAYTGFRHAVAVASGTAAMHLAMRHLNISPGDVVLASSLTFIGSITPAVFQGAELVFIDSGESDWNMDPNLLEEELRDLQKKGVTPKAIVPTDIYGQCCNMEVILDLGRQYDVPVLCDSAEAMGARYRGKKSDVGGSETGDRRLETIDRRQGDGRQTSEVGSRNSEDGVGSIEAGGAWLHAGYNSYAAVYSFNGNKIITTGGGGVLASDDEELIGHARKLATQARDPAPHYEHTEIGYNYRLSNLAAAVGVGQMSVLNQRVERRREIFELYRHELADVPGITFMPEPAWSRSTHWLTVLQMDRRACSVAPLDAMQRLEQENIESRPVWKPMHMQPVFRGRRMVGGRVCERLFENGLCLPSGSALSDDDVRGVCGCLREMVC